MIALRFGYNAGVPEDRTVAWGCRAIVNGSEVDVVWDRQDAVGPDEPRGRLLAHLRDVVGQQPFDQVSRLLEGREMLSSREGEHVVFKDDVVEVKANTNGSYGYVYVAAYFASADLEREEGAQ